MRMTRILCQPNYTLYIINYTLSIIHYTQFAWQKLNTLILKFLIIKTITCESQVKLITYLFKDNCG